MNLNRGLQATLMGLMIACVGYFLGGALTDYAFFTLGSPWFFLGAAYLFLAARMFIPKHRVFFLALVVQAVVVWLLRTNEVAWHYGRGFKYLVWSAFGLTTLPFLFRLLMTGTMFAPRLNQDDPYVPPSFDEDGFNFDDPIGPVVPKQFSIQADWVLPIGAVLLASILCGLGVSMFASTAIGITAGVGFGVLAGWVFIKDPNFLWSLLGGIG